MEIIAAWRTSKEAITLQRTSSGLYRLNYKSSDDTWFAECWEARSDKVAIQTVEQSGAH